MQNDLTLVNANARQQRN